MDMKVIKYTPIEEKTLNDKLVNLYGAKIPGLYAAVESLFDDRDTVKPALPLLIELNDDESYEKADLRIMVFGRETNNWNDEEHRKDFPLFAYNFDISTSEDVLHEIRGKHFDDELVDNELGIYGICDIYNSYFHEKAEKQSLFSRRVDSLIDMLRAKVPSMNIEYLWNNLYKIGRGRAGQGKCRGKQTVKIGDIERKYFNIVAEEVRILKPDVIVFMLGYYEDHRIKEIFNLDDSAFHPVKEDIFLDRIDIPGIKYAARTIHPSQPGITKEHREAHSNALIEDIISEL